jgi:anti-sigma-K factor RskA
MTLDQDKTISAAEYVLGTLDLAEREQAEESIRSEPAFAALVQSWEKRLGELHALVDAVEPPAEIWERIKARLAGVEPSAVMRLPEVSPPPAAITVSATAEDAGRTVVDLTRRLHRWRGASAAMAALAAALAAVVVTAGLAPDLLPPPLRPEPQVIEVVKTIETAVPAPTPTPARFVAVLQSDAASPAFILTVDVATRSLTVRRVSAAEQAGKSYELWLVSDRFPAPRSLGVVGAAAFTQPATLAAYDPDTISDATYAVSLEPEGGSPTGLPSGPVLWTGKLVETVPPARPDQSR